MQKSIAVILLIIPVVSFAQEIKPAHHETHYHLAVFGGYATDNHGAYGYKLGLEYEYRVSDVVGIAAALDFLGKDFKIFAISVGGSFYPFRFPLILGASVGVKNHDEVWDPFIRTTGLYNFHFNRISIGPMVILDFFPNEKNVVSFGATIGYSLD